MKRYAVFLIIAFVSACTSPHILNTYTLSPKIWEKSVQNSPYANSALRVAYPKGIKEAMGDRIYFKEGKFTEAYYRFSQWNSSLNRILMKDLLENIKASHIFKDVVDYSSTANIDYILESDIVDFIHIVQSKDKSYADIKIILRLLNANGDTIVKSKTFSYKIPCSTTDAKGFIEAANLAISKLNSDMIKWLIYK